MKGRELQATLDALDMTCCELAVHLRVSSRTVILWCDCEERDVPDWAVGLVNELVRINGVLVLPTKAEAVEFVAQHVEPIMPTPEHLDFRGSYTEHEPVQAPKLTRHDLSLPKPELVEGKYYEHDVDDELDTSSDEALRALWCAIVTLAVSVILFEWLVS